MAGLIMKLYSFVFSTPMQTQLLSLAYTLDTIDIAVKQFWETVNKYHVFAFSGEMGAGKTTFIHHLCDHLKVEDTVSSPTFALINEYHFATGYKDTTLYHMDWYRVKSTEEAMEAGMEDCIIQAKQDNVYCFIEWPEKAKELLTKPYLWITIETVSITEREMAVTVIN